MQPGQVENPYAPPPSAVAAPNSSDLLLSDIAAFVSEPLHPQSPLAYYVQKWRTHPLDWFMGSNWPACIFSGLWCFYRKRYLLGTAVMVGQNIASIVLTYGLSRLIGYRSTAVAIAEVVLLLALHGAFGLVANGLYLGAAVATSQRVRSRYASEPIIRAQLQHAGGTSRLSIVPALGLGFLLSFLAGTLLPQF